MVRLIGYQNSFEFVKGDRYLHLLCQFFLDRTAPTHNQGQRSSFSFLIDMASLYEDFVAEWLKRHLPSHLRLEKQCNIDIGLTCRIDLVIKDIQ